MKARFFKLTSFGLWARLREKLSELFSRRVTVHYTSVPIWRPWRDF
jgi:hypothetical protein